MEKDYLCCAGDEWELRTKMTGNSILTCVEPVSLLSNNGMATCL